MFAIRRLGEFELVSLVAELLFLELVVDTVVILSSRRDSELSLSRMVGPSEL
jgi:hypothetical protein